MSSADTASSAPDHGVDASSNTLDVFTCLHSRDAEYLWPLVLESKARFLNIPGRYVVVTNDVAVAERALERHHPGHEVEVLPDEAVLTPEEMSLPGWYRQQVIKLKAHRLFSSDVFCNLGADTILLSPVEREDLVGPEGPYLWYSTHGRLERHFVYETLRVVFAGRNLGVIPRRALRHPDYINDLFCFSRAVQEKLEAHMVARYGENPYVSLLQGRSTSSLSQVRFGEWTLYATFLLDVLGAQVQMRDTQADGLVVQVHSERSLDHLALTGKAAHLVPKQMDTARVEQAVRQAWERQAQERHP